MQIVRRLRIGRVLKGDAVATVAAISFSLTFVGVSLALLAGMLPERLATLTATLDTGVVLLFVPLCALVLAIIAEVARTSTTSVFRASTRPTRPLSHRPVVRAGN